MPGQNPDGLKIIYHPAMKRVEFEILEDGKSINITDENLDKYSKKDNFILNFQGKDFFKDIMHPLQGKDEVDVSLRTTKVDYEDFKNMVDDYNAHKDEDDVKINLKPLDESDELLDMGEAFNQIKESGDKISKLLNDYQTEISNIKCSGDNLKFRDEMLSSLKKKKEEIDDKLKKLGSGNVNLCFVGAYSSGKSTLINAILGYKILPVSIKSETAKMIEISGVEDFEKTSIKFTKSNNKCLIKRENRTFAVDCSDEQIKTEFESAINENKDKEIYEQIYCLLEKINKDSDVDSKIELRIPIPLNEENLKFTIYDTPGSDSNYEEHEKTLKEALKQQENCILIFVFNPDSMEATGNHMITQFLLNKNSDSNSIDIERSFFVINKADSNLDVLEELKNEEITSDSGDKIDLSEKKVFFTSAKWGFSAAALKNEIADENAEETFEDDHEKAAREKNRCYRHNHYAKSEYKTKSMLEKSDKEFDNSDNKYDKFLIASGMWTLEESIKDYGRRYSSSTKTAAILKTMNSAIKAVEGYASEQESSASSRKEDVKKKIDEEIQHIKDLLNEIKTNNFPAARLSSVENKKKLGIDSQTFANLVTNITNSLKESLKKKTAAEYKNCVFRVSIIFNNYINDYKNERYKLLREEQNRFINDFLAKVKQSENLSKEIKAKMKDFQQPDIPDFKVESNLECIIKAEKEKPRNLVNKLINAFTKDGSTKKSIINQCANWLNQNQTYITETLEGDYKNSLDQVCADLEEEFTSNADRYSKKVKALEENKEVYEEIETKVGELKSKTDEIKNGLKI